MDSNESHQGSRAGLWSEAFNFVLPPPHRPLRNLQKLLRISEDLYGVFRFLKVSTEPTKEATRAPGRKNLFSSSSHPPYLEASMGGVMDS